METTYLHAQEGTSLECTKFLVSSFFFFSLFIFYTY